MPAVETPLQHLLVPTRETRNIDLLSRVCFWTGVQVSRLAPGSENQLPAGCTLTNSAVHGGTGFCRKVAAALNATVVEPADEFLALLPFEYANRRIELMCFDEARSTAQTRFIKPANDKRFPAGIYASGADLAADASLNDEMVLVSEPVEWECEFRMFVREREIKTSSPYYQPRANLVTNEQCAAARLFCERVVADHRVKLPRAVVMDVGYIRKVGWAVVELNAAVMSSIYDCDPVVVLSIFPAGLTPIKD